MICHKNLNPEFGTQEDFKALVRKAHEHDMKLIIDWVANHTGWDHHWVHEHPEWYIKDKDGNFTERNNWHDVIDLDFSNHHMRHIRIFMLTNCAQANGISTQRLRLIIRSLPNTGSK